MYTNFLLHTENELFSHDTNKHLFGWAEFVSFIWLWNYEIEVRNIANFKKIEYVTYRSHSAIEDEGCNTFSAFRWIC